MNGDPRRLGVQGGPRASGIARPRTRNKVTCEVIKHLPKLLYITALRVRVKVGIHGTFIHTSPNGNAVPRAMGRKGKFGRSPVGVRLRARPRGAHWHWHSRRCSRKTQMRQRRRSTAKYAGTQPIHCTCDGTVRGAGACGMGMAAMSDSRIGNQRWARSPRSKGSTREGACASPTHSRNRDHESARVPFRVSYCFLMRMWM